MGGTTSTIQCVGSQACANLVLDCPTTPAGPCIVNCNGYRSCSNAIINCPSNWDCKVKFKGTESGLNTEVFSKQSDLLEIVVNSDLAVKSASIECPNGELCDINVKSYADAFIESTIDSGNNGIIKIRSDGSDGFSDNVINGQDAILVKMISNTDENSFSKSEIYCPVNAPGSTGCKLSSIYENTFLDSNLYAVDGFFDINFTETGVGYNELTLKCKSDYSASCPIIYDSMNDEVICDADESINGDFCQFMDDFIINCFESDSCNGGETISCPNDNNCIINCVGSSPGWCQAIFECPNDYNCTFNSFGGYSVWGSTIMCPRDGVSHCTINAVNDDKGFVYSLINGTEAGLLEINAQVNLAFNWMNIHCPENNECIIDGGTYNKAFWGINISSSVDSIITITGEGDATFSGTTIDGYDAAVLQVVSIQNNGKNVFENSIIICPIAINDIKTCELDSNDDSTFWSSVIKAVNGFLDVEFIGTGYDSNNGSSSSSIELKCESDYSKQCQITVDINDEIICDPFLSQDGTFCETMA